MTHKKSVLTLTSCILAAVMLLSTVSCSKNNSAQERKSKHKTDHDEPRITTSAETPSDQLTTVTTSITEITTLQPDPDTISEEPLITDYELPPICAALYDFTDNCLLLSTDLYEPIYPASTTKILTSLFALTILDPDDICFIGDEQKLVAWDSSFAGIKKGENMSLEHLLYAMLLRSGNDAAYAVAANCGRVLGDDPYTEENEGEALSAEDAVNLFMDGINDFAFEIGMQNTHFVTPDGYHRDNHYTCLYDVLVMVKTALENDEIMKITSTYQTSFTTVSGRKFSMKNTNALLNPDSPYYMEGTIGLKTGFTSNAGGCVITVTQRDGHTVAALVYRAQNNTARFKHAYDLLNFAWETIGQQ